MKYANSIVLNFNVETPRFLECFGTHQKDVKPLILALPLYHVLLERCIRFWAQILWVLELNEHLLKFYDWSSVKALSWPIDLL